MPSRKTGLSLALLAPALAAFPGAADACAACFYGLGARALRSYYMTTIMLTLLPVALIGLVALAAYAMRPRPFHPGRVFNLGGRGKRCYAKNGAKLLASRSDVMGDDRRVREGCAPKLG